MKALVLVAVVLFSGCAAKLPKQKAILFRNCKVVEQQAAALSCDCKDIAWAVDAKSGAPVALCGARTRK